MTTAELESRLIYAAIVAGKSANFADAVCATLWNHCQPGETPFAMVKRLRDCGNLGTALRVCRTGNYTKLRRCLIELIEANLDLYTCTAADLERIHGIGPKTSRFFLLWTRPDTAQHAALDVHILRWLRTQGHDAPKSTPPAGPIYSKWEAVFLQEAAARGKSPRDLDYQIWQAGTGRTQETAGL